MVQKLRIESGVLTTDASLRVAGIVEKPSVEHRINLGVYVLAEHVAELITPNERLEMPQLAGQLIDRGEQASPTTIAAAGATSALPRTSPRRKPKRRRGRRRWERKKRGRKVE